METDATSSGRAEGGHVDAAGMLRGALGEGTLTLNSDLSRPSDMRGSLGLANCLYHGGWGGTWGVLACALLRAKP